MKLTPAVEATILAYLRAGGFPHVAAEAAGVPRETFDAWMQRGKDRRGARRCRLFRIAVLQAQAQARLIAETKALKEKPMDWLKCGPGRQTTNSTGWSAPPRAASEGDAAGDLFRHPELQGLLSALLNVLDPYPEARNAVTQAFAAADATTNQGKKRK